MSALIRRMLSGFVCSLVAVCCASAVVADGPKASASKAAITRNFGNLPLSFEPNRGQSDPRVKFISRTHNETLFLTQTGATIAMTRQGLTPAPSTRSGSVVAGIRNAAFRVPPRLESSSVRMEFVGASGSAKIEGVGRNAGVTNYFVGADPKKWHANIPNYSKVRYTDLYRGVDLLFYGDSRHFEYDLIVAPGANPRAVRIRFDGANKIDIDKSGDLAIGVKDDQVVLRKAVVYQERGGKRTRIDGHYVLLDRRTVAFEVGRYDHNSPLVIDPSLTWAKILPGNFLDITNAVATDSSSNPYVTGFTCSSDFSMQNGPAISTSPLNGCDAFVTKLNGDPSGNNTGSVVYTSIFGGSSFEQGFGITVDGSGAAYVVGQTLSGDFSDAPGQLAASAPYDAFVAKLDPTGVLLWAQLLGGSHPTFPPPAWGWSIAYSVAVPQGCHDGCPAYVAGQTSVTDFPHTAGAIQGSSLNIAEAFLTVIKPDGSDVAYSTYYGAGSDPQNVGPTDWAFGVAVDGSGQAYITGGTELINLRTTSGFENSHSGGIDCWIAKIDTTSATPVYSRFLGGSDYDVCRAIAIDPGCAGSCSAYLTGVTWSSDFPHTANAYQQTFGGASDAFVTKLDSSGNVTYSSFLGNVAGDSGSSIAVDSVGDAYVTGAVANSFPQYNPVQGTIPLNGNVLVSVDGGVTFSTTNYPPSAGLVTGTIQLDSNTREIFTGAYETGVQRSGDGGATWSSFGTPNTMGMVPDPNDTSIFYGGGFNGLFRSTDGGGSFMPTQITDELSAVVALDTNTSPSTVYAGTGVGARTSNTIGRVYKSIDSGVTFTQVSGLNATTIFSLAVDPNEGTLYAGTSRGLFLTTNFAPTGSMTTPREWMPAALLQDGTVLVPGGFRNFNNPPLASAELYDPSAGTFSSTGSMQKARAFHTATTLLSGKVLITGGSDGTNNLASAELYDPVAKTFSSTVSMTHARASHTATLLNDGTVVVIGDCCAERYDPVHQTFSAAGNLVTPRSQHTATLITTGVNAGKVLVVGGSANSDDSSLASAELYDPSTNTFTATGSMANPREGHVAASLPGGSILVAGGEIGPYPGTPVMPAEIYDSVSGTFTTTIDISVPRVGASAVALPSGNVIILSGNDPTQLSNTATTEIYNPDQDAFSPGGLMTVPRNAFPALLLPSGKVWMAGANRGPNLDAEQTAELYDPNSFGFHLAGNHGVFARPILSVAVDSTTIPSTVYTADENGVEKSTDGFNNLSFIDFNAGGGFSTLALDLSNTPATLYAGDGNGELISSTDTGDHVLVQNIHGFKPGGVTALATPSDGTTVYASVNDEFDAFVTKLDTNSSTPQPPLFSSFIGGSQGDFSNGIALAPDGSAYVTGGTGSGDFNSAAGQLEGRDNPFIAKLPNTLAGSGQTQQLNPTTSITFPTVVSGGNTVATSSVTGPQLPPGLSLVAGTTYTDIGTTATVAASDSFPITVCFAYNPAQVPDSAKLSLMHFENGQWINVTTQIDTKADIICGGVTSLSPFAVVIGKPVTVTIQIKPPSSAPVPINLSSGGGVPIAILSTSTFDATKVAPSSIVIDGAKVNLKGKGTFQCSSQDVNGDHRADLVCQVTTNQIDLIPGSDMAILTATTTSGTPIQGQEAINVVKQ